MATVAEHLSGFPQFRDKYLIDLPAGSEVTHLMPFPGHYPGDMPTILELREQGATLENLIHPAYLEFAARLTATGVKLGRLVMAHRPESARFDPVHTREITEVIAPLPAVKETPRLAYYEEQIGRLFDACTRYNQPASAYVWGVDHGLPKESLWSVRIPANEGSLALQAIWRASYHRHSTGEVEFLGGPVMVTPFTTAGEIEKYEAFWHSVYASSHSIPLSSDPVTLKAHA